MDAPPSAYRFGRFELQTEERRLLVDGVPGPIAQRTLDVLIVLVQRAGELVTKEELLEIVWSDAFVEDGNLQVQISHLRKALGANAIETAPGRGYRFTLPVSAGATCGLKHNLPATQTPFFAREPLLATCLEALGRTRLLTLTGRAGIGKSRLAREVAHRCVAAYRDGVWLVDVSDAREDNEVERLAAAALPIAHDAQQDPLASAIAFVRERHMLIVLDNCERAVDACAALAHRLLSSSARLDIAATSREPLRLPGESTLVVPPLEVPDDDDASDVRTAMSCESVQLFVACARAARPSLELSDADASMVAHICREVDGVPLAIESAAAQAAVLSIAAIAESIDCESPSVEQRGYAELSEGEWAVLAKAASFSETFTLAAVQAACSDADGIDVLDGLGQLVEKSLMVFDAHADRYRVPAAVRRRVLAATRGDANPSAASPGG